jgi:hypothetical protein
MTRSGRSVTLAAALFLATAGASGLAAQEHGGTADVARDAVAPATQHEATRNQIDIEHHIGNAHEIETPLVEASLRERSGKTGFTILMELQRRYFMVFTN